MLKMVGVNLGRKVFIGPHCFIGNSNLEIGNNVFINYNCWFNTGGGIKIGDNCNIAYKCTFITSSHEIGDINKRAGKDICKSIEIGKGVWIGANVTVLPGVKIGDGAVVGAGAVVTNDLEGNGIYAGNPARLIKKII